MVNILITDTTPAYLRELAKTMREADRKEITCLGISTMKGLWLSYKSAVISKTAIIDDKVAAIWGVGGVLLGKTGDPWLLTSHEVEKISPITFVRIYKKEVLEMLKLFPRLANMVDASYYKSIKLLEMCGFQLSEPELIESTYFRKFERN